MQNYSTPHRNLQTAISLHENLADFYLTKCHDTIMTSNGIFGRWFVLFLAELTYIHTLQENPPYKQLSLHQPGDLYRRVHAPRPRRPATAAQHRALSQLINRTGRTAYRQCRRACGIDEHVSLARLSKSEAWRLIQKITNDLEHKR